MQSATVQESGLDYFVEGSSRKLKARYSPKGTKASLDVEGVKRQLAASKFSALHINDGALADLVRKYQAANAAFELEIGEERDGEFRIDMAPDLMSVRLLLSPPRGGAAVDKAAVLAQLAQLGVVHGVQEAQIDAALRSTQEEDVVIAKGVAPVDGQDGVLKSLVSQASERKPTLTEEGIANFRELGGIITVKEGEELMRRLAPVQGKAGTNVLGQSVAPKEGKVVAFAAHLDGAVLDGNDPDLLRAAIPGQPVVVPDGMRVDPVMTIDSVDMSSGNIHFDGTVVIRHDVQAGMTIEATGDIQIGGTLEAATLIAGGNVRIAGGAIGSSTGSKATAVAISSVRCGGSLHARFVQNAHVLAEDSIYVDEVAMQSELRATNQIIIGKDNTVKGNLIGGKACASLLVKAQTLGAPSYVKTVVEVGVNSHLHAELAELLKTLESKEQARGNVDKLLAMFKANPRKANPEVVSKALNARAKAQEEIDQLLATRDELTRQISLAESSQAIANRMLYVGTRILIGHRAYDAREDLEAVAFSLCGNEIVKDLLSRKTAPTEAPAAWVRSKQ